MTATLLGTVQPAVQGLPAVQQQQLQGPAAQALPGDRGSTLLPPPEVPTVLH